MNYLSLISTVLMFLGFVLTIELRYFEITNDSLILTLYFFVCDSDRFKEISVAHLFRSFLSVGILCFRTEMKYF